MSSYPGQRKKGIDESERILSTVSLTFVEHRQGLQHEIISSISDKHFTHPEYTLVKQFIEFIMNYNGTKVVLCDFIIKMKDIVCVSRWMSVNRVTSVITQLSKLKSLYRHFVEMRDLITDLATFPANGLSKPK